MFICETPGFKVIVSLTEFESITVLKVHLTEENIIVSSEKQSKDISLFGSLISGGNCIMMKLFSETGTVGVI